MSTGKTAEQRARDLRIQLEASGRYGPVDATDPHDGSVQSKVEAIIADAIRDAEERGKATYKYCSDAILKAGLPTITQGDDSRLAAPKGHILDDAGTLIDIRDSDKMRAWLRNTGVQL